MGEPDRPLEGPVIGRRKFLTGLAALGVVGSASALLGACGGTTPAGSPGTRAATKTLSVGVFQNPDSLDPGQTGLITVSQILFTIFDPLVWKFPNDRTYYPGLAESWTISSDAETYTFKLRKGVTFQDGTPFNAAAVKATFDHIVDPATKSLSAIGSLGPYDRTEVVDNYTAKVVFRSPNAAFINEVTNATLGISSPTALQKYGSGYSKHPVGTGPFMFESFVNDEEVRVTKFEKYSWAPTPLGTGAAKLGGITFRILPDPSSQADALDTGEIQIAQNLNPGDVNTAVSAGKRKLTALSTGMPYCIMVNAQKPPTDELAVRQALEYATDNKAIVDTLFQGLYQPADSLLTPLTPGYSSSDAIFHYDKARAASLLNSAGWTMGSNGLRSRGGKQLSLEFINIANFGFDGISQILQAQWKEVGIATTITDQAFPSVAATYNQGKQNLADWFYYDVDPYLLNTVFNSAQIKNGFNWEHYANLAVDSTIAAANADTNTASRTNKYQKIALELMQSATIIPIYNLESILVTEPAVKGVRFSLTAQPLFHAVSF